MGQINSTQSKPGQDRFHTPQKWASEGRQRYTHVAAVYTPVNGCQQYTGCQIITGLHQSRMRIEITKICTQQPKVCLSTSVILLPHWQYGVQCINFNLGHSNSEKDCSLPPVFLNTSPALNEQCSKPILIILMISYRGYANVILSKSIQYNGDYKQLQKRSEAHTILCFVPEIHGINQTNGAIAGHSLSSFQRGPVTFHAIHVSWPAWLHPAKRHWDIRDIPKEWIKRGKEMERNWSAHGSVGIWVPYRVKGVRVDPHN